MKLVREMMVADAGAYDFTGDDGRHVTGAWVELLDLEGGVFRATCAIDAPVPKVMDRANFEIELTARGRDLKLRYLGRAESNGAQAKPDPKPPAAA